MSSFNSLFKFFYRNGTINNVAFPTGTKVENLNKIKEIPIKIQEDNENEFNNEYATDMNIMDFEIEATPRKDQTTKFDNPLLSFNKNIKINELKVSVWEIFLQHKKKDKPVLFSELYSFLINSQQIEYQTMKVQSLFLTLLHLSNEKNLIIDQTDNDLSINTTE